MKRTSPAGGDRFRVWITACAAWQPRGWRDLPPRAVALEPAETETMSGRRGSRVCRGL